MSVQFAIPATTFVLKAIVEARIKVAYGALTPPKVTVEPPPRPAATPAVGSQPESPGLILYMHHAGANPAWRNMYDPHVDGAGTRIANAPLVLDLHYLLAATGADLEREVLLGIGMSALHRNGIVARPLIQAILGAIAVPATPTKLLESLTGEPLHDPASQPEQITVSQQAVDVDMSTKLWSALQSPIRPCAYYLVTTVFLDAGDVFPPPVSVDKISIAARPQVDPGADPLNDDILITTDVGGPP